MRHSVHEATGLDQTENDLARGSPAESDVQLFMSNKVRAKVEADSRKESSLALVGCHGSATSQRDLAPVEGHTSLLLPELDATTVERPEALPLPRAILKPCRSTTTAAGLCGGVREASRCMCCYVVWLLDYALIVLHECVSWLNSYFVRANVLAEEVLAEVLDRTAQKLAGVTCITFSLLDVSHLQFPQPHSCRD